MKGRKDSPRPAPPQPAREVPAPRRIGRIVRDDRDSATVEWVDAPRDYHRVPLSIEGAPAPAAPRPAVGGYDPYATDSPVTAQPSREARPQRPRDLRKLSEWIKQMRELEERKKRDRE